MDRLICGDVSFGKTEVALRAALRAAANGKQVAFLCPTTILALQHYRNFERRLAAFPLRLAMLSRLVGAGERKRILAGVKSGAVDLVVGTHSLLAKGVEFKNLGLFIVDEEQRFGVFQKEKLKKGRENVDVLTLSATPIPRTLSMALAGLQDISLIQSPPLGRLAITNFVGLFSRQVVVSAVLNEIERDGAVFVVYNNIERIFHFRDQLASWLPDVAIAVVHAQMPVAAIEKNLMDFIAGKFRVLLSTTIIENGIDIPRVNTLVVMNADRLGLTQMYQLRGRIGRSTRQAYAYFLVDPLKGGDDRQGQEAPGRHPRVLRAGLGLQAGRVRPDPARRRRAAGQPPARPRRGAGLRLFPRAAAADHPRVQGRGGGGEGAGAARPFPLRHQRGVHRQHRRAHPRLPPRAGGAPRRTSWRRWPPSCATATATRRPAWRRYSTWGRSSSSPASTAGTGPRFTPTAWPSAPGARSACPPAGPSSSRACGRWTKETSSWSSPPWTISWRWAASWRGYFNKESVSDSDSVSKKIKGV